MPSTSAMAICKGWIISAIQAPNSVPPHSRRRILRERCCVIESQADKSRESDTAQITSGFQRLVQQPGIRVEDWRQRVSMRPLSILLASPRGFCAGVERAIQTVE